MIVKLFGGPCDGKEMDVPSEWLGEDLRVPEVIATLFITKPYRTLIYRPVIGEIGDLEFTGYEP